MIMYSKTRTFLRFSVVRRQGVGALRTNDICTTYLNTSDQVPRVGFPKSESVSYRSGTTSHSVDVT